MSVVDGWKYFKKNLFQALRDDNHDPQNLHISDPTNASMQAFKVALLSQKISDLMRSVATATDDRPGVVHRRVLLRGWKSRAADKVDDDPIG